MSGEETIADNRIILFTVLKVLICSLNSRWVRLEQFLHDFVPIFVFSELERLNKAPSQSATKRHHKVKHTPPQSKTQISQT